MVSTFFVWLWRLFRLLTLTNVHLKATGAFAEPTQDPFDNSFAVDTSLEDSQDSQDDPLGQFDFSADPSVESLFDIDMFALNEALSGKPHSPGSTPSSSSSVWEFMSQGESSTGPGTGMQFQFPTIDAGVDGNRTDVLTEDEFLKAVMAAAQSTPKNVSLASFILTFCRFFLTTFSVVIMFGRF